MTSTSFGREAASTAKPWFCDVISTFPVRRFKTGWLAPRCPKRSYKTLGLQSYFTAGEKEVRAWTIPIGATAPQGAGVIHTDFERGFIRCEIYTLPDLETYKTEKDIRAAGKLRVEGKSYVMQDGDICHFLFNV